LIEDSVPPRDPLVFCRPVVDRFPSPPPPFPAVIIIHNNMLSNGEMVLICFNSASLLSKVSSTRPRTPRRGFAPNREIVFVQWPLCSPLPSFLLSFRLLSRLPDKKGSSTMLAFLQLHSPPPLGLPVLIYRRTESHSNSRAPTVFGDAVLFAYTGLRQRRHPLTSAPGEPNFPPPLFQRDVFPPPLHGFFDLSLIPVKTRYVAQKWGLFDSLLFTRSSELPLLQCVARPPAIHGPPSSNSVF